MQLARMAALGALLLGVGACAPHPSSYYARADAHRSYHRNNDIMDWAKSTPGACGRYHHRHAERWIEGDPYYGEYSGYSGHEQAGSGCGEPHYGSRSYSYPRHGYGNYYGYRRW